MAGSLDASEQPPVNIDDTLAAVIASARIPGMAAMVLRGDRIIAQGVAGVRKKGMPDLLTIDDQFELGSATKAMTATLAAMLVEEEKLQWETSLGEIFSDVAGVDLAWHRISVRQLFTQNAGIKGPHAFAFLSSVRSAPGNLTRQRMAFATKLLSRAPDLPPGEKFVYSATNYVLAGAVMEKVTGQSWEDLMRERLFAPLDIDSGGFGPPGTKGHVDQPWGHGHRRLWMLPLPGTGGTPFDPGGRNADYPAAAGPAGMAHMCMEHWAKFIAMHLRGDPANPNRHASLLKAETFRELHTLRTGEEEYAAGWFVGTRTWAKGPRLGDRGRVLFHGGDNGRWSTVAWLAPELDFAIIIACNQGGASESVDKVAAALVRFAPLPQTTD